MNLEPEVRPTRFLSFDQIKVSMVSPMEKIFIARDESYIVTLRELETTRRHMVDFTQNMMCMVDDYAIITGQTLKQLMQTELSGVQIKLIEDCLNEMRQARYSIRDFQYVNDVAENNFSEPDFKCVDIRTSLEELRKVCENDARKKNIEIQSEVSNYVPRFIAVEENYFIQVMINLLRMAMDTIVNRGFVKMTTITRPMN